MRKCLLIALVAGTSFLNSAYAKPFPDSSVPVPVERLKANVSRYIKRHPQDPEGYYTLARVHSIAYAQSFMAEGTPKVTILRGSQDKEEQLVPGSVRSINSLSADDPAVNAGKKLPSFYSYWYRVARENPGSTPSPEDLQDLRESVRWYAKATSLAPKKDYYWLGYAWMLEQGVPFASRLGLPWSDPTAKPKPGSSAAWIEKAMGAYRRAYDATNTDEEFTMFNSYIIEASEGLSRLQTIMNRPLTSEEKAERKRIQLAVEKTKRGGLTISPIILPLGDSQKLPDLLSPTSKIKFDLAGDGLNKHWPWVKPDTGILVWDPKREGKITSGRQLFGNVTWWVFWQNGYQALAALDNDADGVLSGSELDELSIWRDGNSNGISDPGEVKPLVEWGILSLATKATHTIEGVPSNLAGATTSNGAVLPTYDWTPRSWD